MIQVDINSVRWVDGLVQELSRFAASEIALSKWHASNYKPTLGNMALKTLISLVFLFLMTVRLPWSLPTPFFEGYDVTVLTDCPVISFLWSALTSDWFASSHQQKWMFLLFLCIEWMPGKDVGSGLLSQNSKWRNLSYTNRYHLYGEKWFCFF